MQTTEIVIRHEHPAVLVAEEVLGLPRRCDACGVLCRDCHFESEVLGGHGAYVTRTFCNDAERCEARRGS